MNDSPGHGRGPRRPRLRRTTALAAIACMALLATACGGSSPAASATGTSTRAQAALAYARCMRSHGVPDFPDPDSNGNFSLPSSSVSSQETAADHVCNHLLSGGTQPNGGLMQQVRLQLVKYAQCMRAHGVPNFPDPQITITNGEIGVANGSISVSVSGAHLDQKSPQYQAAARDCQSLATHAKG